MNELVWNVFNENFNANKIDVVNIFNHLGFMNGCIKANNDCDDDKEKLKESVRRELMYYFWSKCEYEIILSAWPPYDKFNDEKISAYDQVMLNWDVFIEYLWNNRKLIPKRKYEI